MPSEKASGEALHWLIALQEDPDDADLQAGFDTWCKSSPENLSAWNEAQYVWNTVGRASAISYSSEVSLSRSRLASPHLHSIARRKFSSRNIGVLAAGVLSFCIAVMFYPAISIWLAADYATATAEIRQINLEDGSVVHLGADSAIEVAFEQQTRRIRLLTGEAYFEVAPNKDRPFKVEAANVETTVLGTAFDVKLIAGGVAVAVNHGRVGVASAEADQALGAPLEAGDWVKISRNGEVERGNDAPELAGGWRSGMLVVKDWPIADVVGELRRHYKGTIILADGNLGEQRVTGVYDLKNPIDALGAVAQAHGAQMRQVSGFLTIISRY